MFCIGTVTVLKFYFLIRLCRRLDVTLCTAQTYKDSSNETHVDIIDSVRGKDVFIIQSGHGYIYTVLLYC